ncbi:hypothetical protein MH117_04115 [Paenibacillus sp. ACRRX]|uniref:hypothetical protein n=1 Tax=Paenibacillus sp. ACRRX TaxID=2918206 RepID=UPI001EF3EFAC|nr:hypothetical protein [Paenibacillus sp. ACRRX]MCG7406592.1 hypothetical protein [Paenibacillus sp. ACRRX]
MSVLGVRCTKEEIYVAVLEGTVEEPIIKDEARIKIVLSVPKTAESRAEQLFNLRRDFEQIIQKYNPTVVLIKDQETSVHKIPVQASAQRGEIEGIVLEVCYKNEIPSDKILYAQTKTKLNMEQKGKSYQFTKVDEIINFKLKDEMKDAFLCAWACLK